MLQDRKPPLSFENEAKVDENLIEVGLPSYDASVSGKSQQSTNLADDRSYRDNPDNKVASAQSYSSQEVGLSCGSSSRSKSQGLFSSWGSRSNASASLQGLYKDIISRPDMPTADIFSTILETCKKGGISLDTITTTLDGHRPIFWMIVYAKKMPGTIQLFLDQTNKLTRPTLKDIQEGKAACLVNDSLDLYRQLSLVENQVSVPKTFETQASDTIEVIKTESPVLGFIANVTFQDFATRYRTNRNIAISFPARHREWTLRLGLSALPDPLVQRDVMRDQAVKIAELLLTQGETLPCTAQVRLRHPNHAMESDWLKLRDLKVVSSAMRGTLPSRQTLVAFCGPSKLSTVPDWRALEFGEGDFLDSSGNLSLQLQVVATRPRQATDGDCCIQ